MKKRIFMALLAAVSTFAMVSCGDDKDDDPKPSGKVATEATYGETSNTVWMEMPVELEDGVAGSASEKTIFEFTNDKVSRMYSTTTCSSSALAQQVFEEANKAMNEPTGEEEDAGIKDVKLDGNNVIVEYEIPEEYEDASKKEVLESVKIIVAMMNADLSGVVDDMMGGLTDGGLGDLEGAED